MKSIKTIASISLCTLTLTVSDNLIASLSEDVNLDQPNYKPISNIDIDAPELQHFPSTSSKREIDLSSLAEFNLPSEFWEFAEIPNEIQTPPQPHFQKKIPQKARRKKESVQSPYYIRDTTNSPQKSRSLPEKFVIEPGKIFSPDLDGLLPFEKTQSLWQSSENRIPNLNTTVDLENLLNNSNLPAPQFTTTHAVVSFQPSKPIQSFPVGIEFNWKQFLN